MGFWVDVEASASYHFDDDISEEEALEKAEEWFQDIIPYLSIVREGEE